jgi:non-heme chloroperoxidase
MRLAIKTMRVERFTRFTLWLSRFTMGSQWLQRNRDFNEYLKHCMQNIEGSEYLKIWAALYKFREAPLSKIACPTLVLNGEYESKNAYRHAQEILRCVPNCETGVIPAASHAMNLEEPGHFNELVEKFLQRSLEHHRAC